MTGANLRGLLATAAQPFPWIVMRDGEVVSVCTDDGEHEIIPFHEGIEQVAPEHARLIALCPEAVSLLADMADLLENGSLEERPALALLERFRVLDEKAGGE